MEKLTFKTDDEVIRHAQDVLAKRVYIPPSAKRLLDDGENRPLREYLGSKLGGLDVEHFMAAFFSPDGRLIKDAIIAKGTEKQVDGNLREVARQALLANATYVVVAHNHPNGDSTPSREDRNATKRLWQVLSLFDIQLVMAFVVAGSTADKVVPIPPPHEERRVMTIDELFAQIL